METVSYTRKDGKQITYKRRKPINEKVVCDLCGKSFKSYAARSTHFTYVHSEKGFESHLGHAGETAAKGP